ncbi:hypothetical protein ACP70R_002924 [Stipagrostis hirtigluma subsp. patula]
MPSSSASRRRRRNNNKPAPPEPRPWALERARGPASPPRDAPPAAARELGRPPRRHPAPPPNPGPPESEPETRPAMLPASFSSAASLRHRLRRGRIQEEEEEEEARDWAELPLDAIHAVLRRLDHVDILMGAGQACRSWRGAARDHPALWRRIDMRGHAELEHHLNLYGMARAAIRRARGQCEAFWGEYAADEDVLHFLGDQAPSLKSLRLISCYHIQNEGFAEAIKKFPLLEELELSLCANIGETRVFDVLGKACPQLKRFRLSKDRFYSFEYSGYNEDGTENVYNKDDEALGIASMHGLCSLQLFGNNLTSEGLTAILDGCPHLESLDIRHCFNIAMNDTLRAKCARIKTLKLPCDSTDDYDFLVESPIWSPSGLGMDSDSDDCFYGGPDYILDSDEYDDYCDPFRYLDGVYEAELGAEDRMFLKGMRMFMKEDDDDY